LCVRVLVKECAIWHWPSQYMDLRTNTDTREMYAGFRGKFKAETHSDTHTSFVIRFLSIPFRFRGTTQSMR